MSERDDIAKLTDEVAERYEPKVNCPTCQAPLLFETVTEARAGELITMVLRPDDGCLLQAKTVGGSLQAFGGLMESVSKNLGLKLSACVQTLETQPDGSISMTVRMVKVKQRRRASPPGGRG